MAQFKNRTIFGIFAVVAILGSAIGAMSLFDGAASAGGTPKHFVTADPVNSTPATARIVDYEATNVTNNDAIRQVIQEAVEEDRFVKIKLNESEYDKVKRVLDASPAFVGYGNEERRSGIFINKDGVVVRVQYAAAIPA